VPDLALWLIQNKKEKIKKKIKNLLNSSVSIFFFGLFTVTV